MHDAFMHACLSMHADVHVCVRTLHACIYIYLYAHCIDQGPCKGVVEKQTFNVHTYIYIYIHTYVCVCVSGFTKVLGNTCRHVTRFQEIPRKVSRKIRNSSSSVATYLSKIAGPIRSTTKKTAGKHDGVMKFPTIQVNDT